jgi:hypothetical protein
VPVTISSPVSTVGNKITARSGDSWNFSMSGLGDLQGRVKLWFSVNAAGAADSLATIFIEETDGLTTVNGAAYDTPSHGTISVYYPSGGAINVTVDEVATLMVSGSTDWALKMLDSAGAATTLATGTFIIQKTGVKAIL